MNNKRPEDKVVKGILQTLENWKQVGVVIDYENLSNQGRRFNPITATWIMNTQQGRRDVVAYFKHEGVCWVYLIEAKSDIGEQTQEQKEYHMKFFGLKNVVYEVVRKPSQIGKTLERITSYYKDHVDPLMDNAFEGINP